MQKLDDIDLDALKPAWGDRDSAPRCDDLIISSLNSPSDHMGTYGERKANGKTNTA